MIMRRVLTLTAAAAFALAPLLAAAPQSAADSTPTGTGHGQSSVLGANPSTVGHDIAPAANTSAQNIYPDVRDPALAANDRVAATVSVSSRNITLHIDDPDDMAWADISNGAPGDETWLDRSYDGGQTWTSGSKLGDTTIPTGDTEWRTMMYNIDNPPNGQVGVVRACGEPEGESTIVCTP